MRSQDPAQVLHISAHFFTMGSSPPTCRQLSTHWWQTSAHSPHIRSWSEDPRMR